MTDLVEFLRARLNEDEARAQAAKPGPWRWEIIAEGTPDEQPQLVSESAPALERTVLDAFGEHTVGYLDVSPADREHIARHDPARVLREVEAKRRIIDDHAEHESVPHFCRTCGGTDGPCETKRLLALSYADHPDYDERWRP